MYVKKGRPRSWCKQELDEEILGLGPDDWIDQEDLAVR